MFSFDTKREPEKCIARCGESFCLPGMVSFDTKREPEKCIALRGVTFCLFSACKDAPLGQR